MSAESTPISSSAFALAIQDLPIENIYSKAHEIENSISHLQRSNTQLQEYSDNIRSDGGIEAAQRQEGDKECLDAIKENEVVIERQRERVDLLRKEVERRGGRWHETGGEETNGTTEETNGSTRNGELSDEELRRRMAERIGEDEPDGDGGMHL